MKKELEKAVKILAAGDIDDLLMFWGKVLVEKGIIGKKKITENKEAFKRWPIGNPERL